MLALPIAQNVENLLYMDAQALYGVTAQTAEQRWEAMTMTKFGKAMYVAKLFFCIVMLTIMTIEIVTGDHVDAILTGVCFLIVRGAEIGGRDND
jgi:uncharacterized membrane protein YcfT